MSALAWCIVAAVSFLVSNFVLTVLDLAMGRRPRWLVNAAICAVAVPVAVVLVNWIGGGR